MCDCEKKNMCIYDIKISYHQVERECTRQANNMMSLDSRLQICEQNTIRMCPVCIIILFFI